jgi:hypothetical protein
MRFAPSSKKIDYAGHDITTCCKQHNTADIGLNVLITGNIENYVPD